MTIAKSPVSWFILLAALTLALLALTATPALAAAPDVVDGSDGTAFLCPDVGAGVLNHRPDAGQLASGGYTFLPGHNQAGAQADMNAYNLVGPGESAGPGDGNSDWSPIWPPN